MPERSHRSWTKRTTTWQTAFCALAIAWCLTPWIAVGVATLALPLLIGALVTLTLGYQAVGHLDFRATRDQDAGSTE